MLKKYSLYIYSLVVGLLCIKIGLGLGIAGSINLIFALSIILFFIFYKDIKFIKNFKELRIYLVLYLIVIALAFLSLSYTVERAESARFIRTDLVFVLIIFIFCYMIFSLMKESAIKIFIYSFGISLVVINIFMIIHYIDLYKYYSSLRAISFFDIRASATWTNLIIPFANWHLIAFSFFLSFAIFIKKWKYKIFFIFTILLSVLSMAMSGTRTFAICIPLIILSSFLILKYRYKKIIVSFVFVSICAFSFFVINYSSNWHILQGRFDIKNIINNFNIVWSKAPAQMGQFDINCNNISCSNFSMLEKNKSPIKQDQSSLIRLSLLKSASIAILNNPLRPNGYGHNLFIKNIEERFFSPFDINYPYFYVYTDKQNTASKSSEFKMQAKKYNEFLGNKASGDILSIPHTQQHLHNQLLSFIFELGLFGFLSIAIFTIMQFIVAYKNLRFFTKYSAILSGFSCFMLLYMIGNIIGMIFDIMLYREGITQLFILFALNLALYFNKDFIRKTDAKSIG